MRIIISSDNELGFYIAKFLSKENHIISVINSDKDYLKTFENFNEVLSFEGKPTSVNLLKQAGIEKCDILISVLRDENINITTCILAKSLGAKQTIARIDNIEFLEEKSQMVFKNLGVDAMVCPEKIAANEIVRLIKQAAATEIFDFSDKKLSLLLFKLDEKSTVIGKSLSEIATIHPNLKFRAVAIHRANKTIIPNGTEVFKPNDLAYVIAQPEGIEELLKLSGKVNFKINKIFIAGGSRIGRKTALQLENNRDVYLIEKDPERISELLEVLKETYLIKGDVRNIDILTQENFEEADAYIAVTNSSETNILTSLIAQKMKIKRTITLVDNVEFIDIAQKVGIDAIINKKLLTASYISRFILQDKVTSLRFLTGVDAEVLELIAKPDSMVTKKCLCELKFPKAAIIGGYIRNNKGYIAMGKTQLEAYDKVVVFAMPKDIEKVLDFFN